MKYKQQRFDLTKLEDCRKYMEQIQEGFRRQLCDRTHVLVFDFDGKDKTISELDEMELREIAWHSAIHQHHCGGVQ